MPITSLRLRDFRCFESLSCPLAPGETLFTGDNAQGKTSILEAVCVLLRLQSPRTLAGRELVRFGAPGFGIAGSVNGRELTHTHTLAGTERRLLIDGEASTRPGDYLAASGLVVWMGNNDLELVSGSGEPRRRFLDFLGSQLFPEYRPALRAYEKALKQRNFLLKRDASPAWAEIDAYTAVLVPYGETLLRLRAALLEKLAPHATAAHTAIRMADGGAPASEALSLTFHPGGDSSQLSAQLLARRADEARRRVTLHGPHRDDFLIALDAMPAASFASEGQQRTIALALKLAQATLLREARGQAPVLLLDDIFGELDPGRRNALLAALPADSQKLITTTHLHWLEAHERPAARYHVVKGSVTPE
ncbi:MAG: replication and repair protein RecF [Verrucomicrobiales bacterium]|nr:replication and repair protein RecF [Verrucomicrobiales bacterium]